MLIGLIALLIDLLQGHSIQDVKVEMEEITEAGPEDKVIHGTNLKAWHSIRCILFSC